MRKQLKDFIESQGRDRDHQERLYVAIDYLFLIWIIFLCLLMSYIMIT